jgi:hypothetical protein
MQRRLSFVLGLFSAAWIWPCAAPAQPPDALDEALELVGLRRADLGWSPKGWWPRYPADIPYKLRAFDALFNEPLDTVTFGRSLGQTAWEKLDPATLDKENGHGGRPLFEAVQRLGIDPKFGGFRGYTANVLAPETPLDQALVKLYDVARRTTRPNTFGMELPYPRIAEQLAEQVKLLPEGVSPILGQLVLNIVGAHYWAELAFRRVDPHARLVAATRSNTGEEMIDAWDYCPEFDDVAQTWDEASMWNAAQKCADALDLARIKLQAWKAGHTQPIADFAFDCETPWGWVRVRGGGNDCVNAAGAVGSLLIVDLSGNDTYLGPVAASSVSYPISLLLDLEGNDEYSAGAGPVTGDHARPNPALLGAAGPAQGAGMCGVGVLMDVAGDDQYSAERYAQGVGQFGLGLLVDLAGNDKYGVRYSGQGCGFFGIGLLFDLAGIDNYNIYCDGQGLGGVAGVGVLADRTGDDRYVAERKNSITGRPSYHSPDLDVSVSNAQGCGMGRRGDGADGHSWAGGLGALLDGDGDDYYSAGNWSMGTGYWFGIGILHDRGGDDEYHGVAWSQGTGAHFCIGACIDEAGNDKHLSEENSLLSLGWAHDFTIGILLDVAGNDIYQVDKSGLGGSINRSVAMLIDTGGDDRYESKEIKRPGYAENAAGFRARGGVGTYFADTTSVGLFLDIGGDDTYRMAPTTQPAEDTAAREAAMPGNDRHWLDPPDSPNWADRNFSIGVDRADGDVDFTPRPVKPPSGSARPAVSQ